MSKCHHCPLAGKDEPCRGQRNNRVCLYSDEASPEHRPGFLRKLANFTVAVVGHIVAGAPMATAEVKAARLAVCATCEFHDAEGDRCNQCGCNLSVKAGWSDQACPLDPPRWKAIEAQREGATEAAPTGEATPTG